MMAKIVRQVNDLSNIQLSDLLMELEYVEFVDADGNFKRYKLTGITPISAEGCRSIDNGIDWDSNNFHFIVDIYDRK